MSDNLPVDFNSELAEGLDMAPEQPLSLTDRIRKVLDWMEEEDAPMERFMIIVHYTSHGVSFRCNNVEEFQRMSDLFGWVRASQSEWDYRLTKVKKVAGFEMEALLKIDRRVVEFPGIRMSKEG